VAPINGVITDLVAETGESSVIIANEPDAAGLETCHLTIAGAQGRVGLRLALGGFGPRLDIDLMPDDQVKAGHKIGVRRLGGWTDVYLPVRAQTPLLVGQTLVGAETILCRLEPSENRSAASDVPETKTAAAPVVAPISRTEEASSKDEAVENATLVDDVNDDDEVEASGDDTVGQEDGNIESDADEQDEAAVSDETDAKGADIDDEDDAETEAATQRLFEKLKNQADAPEKD
ncbi:MAG: hypothetical protein AAFQ67_09590, partial [Pseudomonadota bacterium]